MISETESSLILGGRNFVSKLLSEIIIVYIFENPLKKIDVAIDTSIDITLNQ